jgi:hypothetical protein
MLTMTSSPDELGFCTPAPLAEKYRQGFAENGLPDYFEMLPPAGRRMARRQYKAFGTGLYGEHLARARSAPGI